MNKKEFSNLIKGFNDTLKRIERTYADSVLESRYKSLVEHMKLDGIEIKDNGGIRSTNSNFEKFNSGEFNNYISKIKGRTNINSNLNVTKYRKYMNSAVKSISKMSEDLKRDINDKFGSIENFFNHSYDTLNNKLDEIYDFMEQEGLYDSIEDYAIFNKEKSVQAVLDMYEVCDINYPKKRANIFSKTANKVLHQKPKKQKPKTNIFTRTLNSMSKPKKRGRK